MAEFKAIGSTPLFTGAVYRIKAMEKFQTNCYLTADTVGGGGKTKWRDLDSDNHSQMWALFESSDEGDNEYVIKPLSNPSYNMKYHKDHLKTKSGTDEDQDNNRWKIGTKNIDGIKCVSLNNVKHKGYYVKAPKSKGNNDDREFLWFEPVYNLSVSNLVTTAEATSSSTISSSSTPTAVVKQVNESSEDVTMTFSYELEESNTITVTSTQTLHVGYTETLTMKSEVTVEVVKEETSLSMSFEADFTTENSTAKTESKTQKYDISATYIVPARSIGYMQVSVGENVDVDQTVDFTGSLNGRLALMNPRVAGSYSYILVEGDVLRQLCIQEHIVNPGFIYSDDLSQVTMEGSLAGQAKLGYSATYYSESLDA